MQLNELPEQILVYILMQATFDEFLLLISTCKKLYDLSVEYPTSERIYDGRVTILREIHNFIPDKPENIKWKDFYKKIILFYNRQDNLQYNELKHFTQTLYENDVLQLRMLFNIYPNLIPSVTTILNICILGNIDVIKILIEKNIYLPNSCANMAAIHGHIDLISLLYKHDIIIDKSGVCHSITNNQLKVLEWLKDNYIPINYTRHDLQLATCPKIKEFIRQQL